MNGVSTSLRVLRELGAALVDFNGQNAAQGLRCAASACSPLLAPFPRCCMLSAFAHITLPCAIMGQSRAPGRAAEPSIDCICENMAET